MLDPVMFTRPVEIKLVCDENINYGNTLNLSYILESTLASSDVLSDLQITNNHSKTELGTYKITKEELSLGNKNYYIKSVSQGEYTIVKRPITLRVLAPNTVIYGVMPNLNAEICEGEYAYQIENGPIDSEVWYLDWY